MIPRVPLRTALSDPSLLGQVLEGDSWRAWRALLIACMGEELTEDERVLFRQLTGRDREPGRPVEEFVAVKGRRGGGSRAASVLATHVAGLCQHPRLVPGERGVLLCIAADQRQADVVLNYVEANFRGSPILSQLIEGRTARELRLTTGIDIEVRAADYRRLRGLTLIAVIGDEIAFWATDASANPDDEILNAVRPGLASTGGPLFLISSPYARRGELWRIHQRHFGANGDPLILVAQGSTQTFNPTLPNRVIERAYQRDPVSAAAEFGAEFRRDIESFVSIEAVRSCVVGFRERPPQRGVSYQGFVDPSGGSSDPMTLAIGHMDFAKQAVIVDALREVSPPFSPENVVGEFARLLQTYGCGSATGDRYAGVWVTEQFSRFNILFEQAAKPKSELYADALALINSRRIELLDSERLINQLVALERKTSRGGRDSIDHPPGCHDDVANAVAGLASVCIGRPSIDYSGWLDGPEDPHGIEAWRRLRLQFYLESGGRMIL